MATSVTRLIAACVAGWLIWAAIPSAAPEEKPGDVLGTVTGTITLAPVSRPPSVADYVSRAVRPPRANPVAEIRNVLVYIDGAPPPAVLPVARVAIRQIEETFEPRVLAVTRGSTVDFPNDDLFFHNVFSLSQAASFDLGRYERGISRGRTLDTTGIVKVFCDLHSYMSAVVMVLDHPYFASPEDDGRFVLDNVHPARSASRRGTNGSAATPRRSSSSLARLHMSSSPFRCSINDPSIRPPPASSPGRWSRRSPPQRACWES